MAGPCSLAGMRTINVEKNGKNHQTLKGAGGDYGRLEFVPTRKLYVLIVPNCPDSRRSNKTLQKKRAPYSGARSILFSACLRQHCLDQVLKGIFSAFCILSMQIVAPLLKKDVTLRIKIAYSNFSSTDRRRT